jgi:fructokinase
MKKKILCFGEILWDIFPKGSFLGGAPFNVACHLHLLGEDVNIISRVGNDALGKGVIAALKEKGIRTDYIQVDKKHNTGTVNVTLDRRGNASYEIVEPAAWDFIQMNDDLIELAKSSDILVFGSLAQRYPAAQQTLCSLMEIVPFRVFDINLRSPYDDQDVVEKCLFNTQIVKLNEDEMRKLAKWYGLSHELKESMQALSEKFNCESVCVTRGENGAALWRNKKFTEHSGYKIIVKDTVGAGDAFLASFISNLIAGKKNEEILKNANSVGAFIASQDGAIPQL